MITELINLAGFSLDGLPEDELRRFIDQILLELNDQPAVMDGQVGKLRAIHEDDIYIRLAFQPTKLGGEAIPGQVHLLELRFLTSFAKESRKNKNPLEIRVLANEKTAPNAIRGTVVSRDRPSTVLGLLNTILNGLLLQVQLYVVSEGIVLEERYLSEMEILRD